MTYDFRRLQADTKLQCDKLIDRLQSTAQFVRSGNTSGSSSGNSATAAAANPNKVEIKSSMVWRSEIFAVTTKDHLASPYLYTRIQEFFRDDAKENFVRRCQLAGGLQPTTNGSSSGASISGTNNVGGGGGSSIFSAVANAWAEYQVLIKLTGFAFAYLDQYFTQRSSVDPVRVAIRRIFRESGYAQLRPDLLASVQHRVNGIRDGDAYSVREVRTAIEFFKEMTDDPKNPANGTERFHREFLAAFISDTDAFYTKQSLSRIAAIATDGVGAYATWLSEMLSREERLMRDLSLGEQWPTIRPALVRTLIELHLPSLLGGRVGSFQWLLKEERSCELIYSLVAMVAGDRGIAAAATAYGSFLSETIAEMLGPATQATSAATDAKSHAEAAAAEAETMRKVMLFCRKQKFNNLPSELQGNQRLIAAWHSGVQNGFQSFPNAPHLLADYADFVLKDNNSASDRQEDIQMIDTIIAVLSNILEKDKFHIHNKTRFARRLLRGSVRDEMENMFIAKLKVLEGNMVVFPYTVMLDDIRHSENLTQKFIASGGVTSSVSTPEDGSSNSLKVKVTIISAQHWLSMEALDCQLHPSLQDLLGRFEAFYGQINSNRRVGWLHPFANATAILSVKQGQKEVAGSLLQINTLLLIGDASASSSGANGGGGAMPKDIAQSTGLSKEVVMDNIASLVLNRRTNIVECFDPATGKTIEGSKFKDDSCFRINVDYKSPMRRVELPKGRAGKATSSATQAKTAEDTLHRYREQLAQVAIVRFMKSRGKAPYSELLDSAVQQLRMRFDAQPSLVKTQIDELITKGYLKRLEGPEKTMEYIA